MSYVHSITFRHRACALPQYDATQKTEKICTCTHICYLQTSTNLAVCRMYACAHVLFALNCNEHCKRKYGHLNRALNEWFTFQKTANTPLYRMWCYALLCAKKLSSSCCRSGRLRLMDQLQLANLIFRQLNEYNKQMSLILVCRGRLNVVL